MGKESNCEHYLTPEDCNRATSENGGIGKCDEDNTTEISDVPEFENPGLLRSIHKTKLSSPSAWDYLAVFSITFFMTAGVTFFTLGKCTSQEKEAIDMSYRAVV